MTLDQTDLTKISAVLTPRENPIDTIKYPGEGIPADSLPKTGETSRMKRTGTGTTGLDEGFIRVPPINEVETYLNGLDFNDYVSEYYDCDDRAFWGVAHVRARFYGCPVGVISGTCSVGDTAGERHAMIILWEKIGNAHIPRYYSPLPVGGGSYEGLIAESSYSPAKYPFSEVKSIISFPPGPATMTPVDELELLDGVLIYDENRMIYRSDTVFNYLKQGLYYKGKAYACDEDHNPSNPLDKGTYWTNYDRALWAFAHARHDYPGIPLGVALGSHVDGISDSVLILWHNNTNQENDRDLVFKYWDPDPSKKDVVSNFRPTMIFV